MISYAIFKLYVYGAYSLIGIIGLWIGIRQIKGEIKKVDERRAQKEKEHAGEAHTN